MSKKLLSLLLCLVAIFKTETTFAPYEGCTRAQVVTFLWAANGKPAPALKESPFTDVSANDWYCKAVLWAVENGITTGVLKVAAMAEAPNPNDSIASGQIQTAEFIDMANRTVSFMETNGHAPNYITTSLGQMHYYTGVYFFARILNYFGAYGQLPSQAKAEAWAITNGTYVEGSAAFGNDYSGYANYLVPTANCQSTNATIISVAKTGMNYGSAPTSTYGAMYNLMNYLNDNIGYGYYYDTYYGAVGTWNNGEGNCCDSAHLMNACARSLGVPGRYVHAYCRFSSGLETGHVWSEVLCGNEWYTADLVSDYNYLGYKTNSTLEVYGRYIELPF